MTAGQQSWFPQCGEGSGPCCKAWPSDLAETPTSKQVCRCLGADWGATVPQNFDSIFDAICTLFELSTTEGWMDVLYATVDATSVDMQPIKNHEPLWAVWMLCFMLVGNFFFLNLFVGVLYERFTEMQKELKGKTSFLTQKQRDLIDTQRAGLSFRPLLKLRAAPGRVAAWVYPLVTSPWFDGFIAGCILCNTVRESVRSFPKTRRWESGRFDRLRKQHRGTLL